MYRDGSSGGIIRLVNVTKDKVEREFIDYKDVPVKWSNKYKFIINWCIGNINK